MKNIHYPILAFFLLICGNTFSQTFAPLGAEWHYNGGGNFPAFSEYLHYKAVKDTLYKGENAKKIEIERFRYIGDSVQLDPLFVFERNDSVFYYNDQYQRYLLLYDFTASAGDTLFFTIPDTNHIQNNDTLFRVTVDSVKNILVGGKSLKKIYTSPLDNYSFHGGYTEYIGSELLMLPQTIWLILIHDGPIRCYEDSAIFINFLSINCKYRIITSLEENNQLSEDIEIHPNPVKEHVTIDAHGYEIAGIELLNVNGQLVKKLSPSKDKFDFSDVPNGIYFIQSTTKDQKKFSQKLIVYH